MKDHIKILGWLHIILGGLSLLIGIVVLLILTSIGVLSGDREAVLVLPLVGFGIAGFMALIGAPGVIGGIGLLKYKTWARVLTLILGFLNLPAFPIGTALGIYTIWVLLNEETAHLFE
jgi:uncharacterized membrane protein